MLAVAAAAAVSCSFLEGPVIVRTEAEIRAALARKSGVIQLAPGAIEVSSALEIPPGSQDLELRGAPEGSILRVTDGFTGKAVLHCRDSRGVHLSGFSIEGNREALEKPVELPPSNLTFAEFYENNGIVAENVHDLTISGLQFSEITNYAVIVNQGTNVLIEETRVLDSGSRNERNRNNASGGILLENGTTDFEVRNCALERIRGNGIWTHSRYESPRNRSGLIVGNRLWNIARDAIQVGHATEVRVENNSGGSIGFPIEEVDVEGGAMPVGIDTAGNTDRSVYAGNRFEEINGKCIDLDGFHHGEIRGNTCVNRGRAEDYPSGHFGIVMNNSNPDMQSEAIVIEDNEIDGAVYGGIFVIGSGHRIVRNRLRNLNKAGCGEASPDPRCNFWPAEPALLYSGIYLGQRAEREAVTRENLIEGNEITGLGMGETCLAASPGVPLSSNDVRGNDCRGLEGAL